MKKVVLFFSALVTLNSCDGGDTAVDATRSDSLSKVRQRTVADSMKKSNPLLILPPDSSYTGQYVDKYPSGITKFTGFFRFGERHGQWMSFYPNGGLWSEMHYDKGKRHGPNITYFENGKKRYEGFYRDDMQDSVWMYFDSTGKLAEKVLFKENRLVRKLSPD
jgi:antitoxin component YwqK of YwqJK toxin-antitoxin module